jgi:hypothetical protein
MEYIEKKVTIESVRKHGLIEFYDEKDKEFFKDFIKESFTLDTFNGRCKAHIEEDQATKQLRIHSKFFKNLSNEETVIYLSIKNSNTIKITNQPPDTTSKTIMKNTHDESKTIVKKNFEFENKIKSLSEHIANVKEDTDGEAQTKDAFIKPFIELLGYNLSDPREVKGEYTCDNTGKNGTKVDYAILKNNEVIIIIECKQWKEDLDLALHKTQLEKYFQNTAAKFGILTNGIIYKFYTDTLKDGKTKIDEHPFLEIDLTNIKDNQIKMLEKFHNDNFEVKKLTEIATDLKYTSEIKSFIKKEFSEPSKEFISIVGDYVKFSKRLSDPKREKLATLIKKSFSMFINDIVTDRLQSALNSEKETIKNEVAKIEAQEQKESGKDAGKIETTAEELECFYIVRTLLVENIDDPTRIKSEKNKTCFTISVDRPRKILCRISNKKQKLWDLSIGNNKYIINSIYEIRYYKEQLIESLNDLLK